MISSADLAVRKDLLETALTGWMRNLEQVDDVCIIGVEIV